MNTPILTEGVPSERRMRRWVTRATLVVTLVAAIAMMAGLVASPPAEAQQSYYIACHYENHTITQTWYNQRGIRTTQSWTISEKVCLPIYYYTNIYW